MTAEPRGPAGCQEQRTCPPATRGSTLLHPSGTEHMGPEYLRLGRQRRGGHLCLPGHRAVQGQLCGLRGRRGMLASGGHRGRGVRLLRLHGHLELRLRLHHLWLLWKLQRRRQRRSGEAGGGQPAGELRWRCVQAGGVLHRGPRGRVVLLLALLLARELSGVRGGRHPSCKTGRPAALTRGLRRIRPPEPDRAPQCLPQTHCSAIVHANGKFNWREIPVISALMLYTGTGQRKGGA